MHEMYQAQIIERSQHPLFGGALSHPTHTAEGANLSCGDEVRWQTEIENNTITALRHQSRACAICTASADLLAEHLQGKPLTEIKNTTAEDVQNLIGIPLSPIRLSCALLPIETLKTLKEA
jgi:nitrogen fixation NifU-like protein